MSAWVLGLLALLVLGVAAYALAVVGVVGYAVKLLRPPLERWSKCWGGKS